ncbi:hypothetical protein RRG08_008120 [Elysia crispata]|uniref:Uncharacterized protein n=1 Tax=Elysia crispata TaxID=231223 RepID=A0AAE1D6R8_9GAST|nr:hypothetical protein RRG08_008120 [Elysia crispata]
MPPNTWTLPPPNRPCRVTQASAFFAFATPIFDLHGGEGCCLAHAGRHRCGWAVKTSPSCGRRTSKSLARSRRRTLMTTT